MLKLKYILGYWDIRLYDTYVTLLEYIATASYRHNTITSDLEIGKQPIGLVVDNSPIAREIGVQSLSQIESYQNSKRVRLP